MVMLILRNTQRDNVSEDEISFAYKGQIQYVLIVFLSRGAQLCSRNVEM